MMTDCKTGPLAVALLTLFTLIFAAPKTAYPDWNRLDDPLEGGIGLHAGWIGGTGLAFKYPLQWWLQLQAAGAVWNTEKSQWHNIGFEAQYLLRQDSRLRLYLMGGYSYYQRRQREQIDEGPESWTTKKLWNTGLGVGIERLIGERWSFKVDIGFTYRQNKESLIPLPQLGLFYYW